VRGIVEFATREDLKRAIRDLDGALGGCVRFRPWQAAKTIIC